jgi:hypothetical protein
VLKEQAVKQKSFIKKNSVKNEAKRKTFQINKSQKNL